MTGIVRRNLTHGGRPRRLGSTARPPWEIPVVGLSAADRESERNVAMAERRDGRGHAAIQTPERSEQDEGGGPSVSATRA